MDTTPAPTPLAPTTPSTPAPAGPRDRTVLRVAGALLIASCALLLLFDPPVGPPVETTTGEQALAHFAETADLRELQGLLAALLTATWLGALVALREAGRRRQPDGMWGDLLLAAGVLVAADWWLLAAVGAIPTVVDLDTATASTAQVWYALGALDTAHGGVAQVARVVVLAGVAGLGLRAAVLHRPVAWFAVVVGGCTITSGLLALAGLGTVAQGVFYAGLFGFVLVLGAGGVSALLRSRVVA